MKKIYFFITFLAIMLNTQCCKHKIDYSNINADAICKYCKVVRSVEARDDYYDIFLKNHNTRLLSLSPNSRFYYKNDCHIDDLELKQELVDLIKTLQFYKFRRLYIEEDDYIFTTYDGNDVIISQNISKWKYTSRVKLSDNWFYIESQ